MMSWLMGLLFLVAFILGGWGLRLLWGFWNRRRKSLRRDIYPLW